MVRARKALVREQTRPFLPEQRFTLFAVRAAAGYARGRGVIWESGVTLLSSTPGADFHAPHDDLLIRISQLCDIHPHARCAPKGRIYDSARRVRRKLTPSLTWPLAHQRWPSPVLHVKSVRTRRQDRVMRSAAEETRRLSQTVPFWPSALGLSPNSTYQQGAYDVRNPTDR